MMAGGVALMRCRWCIDAIVRLRRNIRGSEQRSDLRFQNYTSFRKPVCSIFDCKYSESIGLVQELVLCWFFVFIDPKFHFLL